MAILIEERSSSARKPRPPARMYSLSLPMWADPAGGQFRVSSRRAARSRVRNRMRGWRRNHGRKGE